MPEYRPDKENQERREQREVSERAAEYKAMPLREIELLENDGKVAVLNCGHRKALLVWLLAGENMRCRDCYEDGMKKARSLIEQNEG